MQSRLQHFASGSVGASCVCAGDASWQGRRNCLLRACLDRKHAHKCALAITAAEGAGLIWCSQQGPRSSEPVTFSLAHIHSEPHLRASQPAAAAAQTQHVPFGASWLIMREIMICAQPWTMPAPHVLQCQFRVADKVGVAYCHSCWKSCG